MKQIKSILDLMIFYFYLMKFERVTVTFLSSVQRESLCFSLIMVFQMFEPYAKYWITPLTELILRMKDSEQPGTEGINYFIVDLVVTMLSWNSTALPEVIASLKHFQS